MPGSYLRTERAEVSVTNTELFFDLVFVFAVTQMSNHLLHGGHPTWGAAGQTAVLLGLVWTSWVYTTWVTNWLDPDVMAVRFLLFAVMLGGLVMAAALPEAFTERGGLVAVVYVAVQIGRSAVAALLTRGSPLYRNFQRILIWSTVSGAVMLIGGFGEERLRAVWWIAAIAIDLVGGVIGFVVPGMGRSTNAGEWSTVEGGHFAERCQAFILIAIGESVVDIGESLSGRFEAGHLSAGQIMAFVGAFIGALALWWIYFDRSGPDSARLVSNTQNSAELLAWAFHRIHVLMIGGIIVTAAADELVIEAPGETAHGPVLWTVFGGIALFLAGHAVFKWVLWHRVSMARVIAVALLAVLGLAHLHMTSLTVGVIGGVVLLAVCAADRVLIGGEQHDRVAGTVAT